MKLAIVIEGAQNSGKTSTIKGLVNLFTDKRLKQMKRGWQHIFLNPIFKSLRLICYCIPASPSETGIKIGKLLNGLCPEVLIVAEQPSGVNYVDTLAYLKTNGYLVKSFSISNKVGLLDWERFDSTSKKTKLNNRANEVVQEIRDFIKSRGIV